jgi:hypothetical protein
MYGEQFECTTSSSRARRGDRPASVRRADAASNMASDLSEP